MRARILILSLLLAGTAAPEGGAVPVSVEQSLLLPSDRGITSRETIRILSRWDAPGYEITADFSDLDEGLGGQAAVVDSANGSYLIVYTTGPMEGFTEESGIVLPIKATDPADGSSFTVFDLEVCRRHLTPWPEHVSTTIAGDSSRFQPGDVMVVLSRWREASSTPSLDIVADFRAVTSDFRETEAFVEDSWREEEESVYQIRYRMPGSQRIGPERNAVGLTVSAKDDLCSEIRSPAFFIDIRKTPPPSPVEHRVLAPSGRGVREGDTVKILSRWDDGGYRLRADFTELDGGAGGEAAVVDSATIDTAAAGSYVISYTPGSIAHLPDSTVAVEITAVDSLGDSFTDRSLLLCRNHTTPPPIHLGSRLRGGRTRLRKTDSLVVISRWSSPAGIDLTVEADYTNLVPSFKPSDATVNWIGADTFLVLYSVPVNKPLVPDGERIRIGVLARDALCSVTRYDSLFIDLDTTPPETPPVFDPLPSQTATTPILFSGTAPGAASVTILRGDDVIGEYEIDEQERFAVEIDLVPGDNRLGGYSADEVGNKTVRGTSRIILYVDSRETIYPTPFRRDDEIVLLDERGLQEAAVQIYNLEGDVIARFETTGQMLETRLQWDGRDLDGRQAQPGYYLMRVRRVLSNGKTEEEVLPMLFRNDD